MNAHIQFFRCLLHTSHILDLKQWKVSKKKKKTSNGFFFVGRKKKKVIKIISQTIQVFWLTFLIEVLAVEMMGILLKGSSEIIVPTFFARKKHCAAIRIGTPIIIIMCLLVLTPRPENTCRNSSSAITYYGITHTLFLSRCRTRADTGDYIILSLC